MYRILDRLKHYLGWIAGIVGVILSWFAGFDLLSKVFTEEHSRSIIAEYYVIFGLIVGSLYLLVRQYMVIRKEKYANITSSLHSALHEIRDLQTYIERNERKKGGDQHNDMKLSNECKIIASRALTHVAQIFSMLTSTHCRASIKLFYEENNKVYVYSFARDAAATQRTRNLDEKRVANNHDPLAENNEMAVLFDDTNENWSFLSNDLPSQKGFRSTSLTAYNPEWATTVGPEKKKWPLPYRSTLTAIIRQGKFDLCGDFSRNIGFLCVDSESRGVFEGRWDTQIIFTIADAFYHPLKGYSEAAQRAKMRNVVNGPQSGTNND